MRSNNSSLFFGLILIFIGLLFILNNTNVMDVGDFFRRFWPVVFIIVGLVLIFKRPNIPSDRVGDRSVISDLENVIQSNVFGDIRVTLESKNFKGGTIRTSFGDVVVDATSVGVTEGEKRLYLTTTFGSIKFAVPRELPIKVQAGNMAGDIKIFGEKWDGLSIRASYESENYESSSTRLHVICHLTFGDIKVY